MHKYMHVYVCISIYKYIYVREKMFWYSYKNDGIISRLAGVAVPLVRDLGDARAHDGHSQHPARPLRPTPYTLHPTP